MSQTSRSAPGDRQGRNKSAGRFKSAITTKRINEGKRAAIHEIGDARRADVYRTDVEFAPPEGHDRFLPAHGTPERAALRDEVVRLRRQGLSYLKISSALDPPWSSATVGKLLKEAGEK